MDTRQRAAWIVVLRLAGIVTIVSALVVLVSGIALWLLERDRPDSTVRTFGEGLWWSLSTITTVGYGDHVPVTTLGRLIAGVVMVVGVAVIGAVAAIVAFAMSLHVAFEEERAFEAGAGALEERVDVRLDRIEALLAGLDTRLNVWSPTSVKDSVRGRRDEP
jgi:voltage-gated potassium channel Kch